MYPELKKRGLIFVGLDVIGDKLTEINVTSPTCIKEIEAAFDVNITGMLMDAIEARINANQLGFIMNFLATCKRSLVVYCYYLALAWQV
ncbi:hypothetical protein PEC18_30660 [Paucibacter sp. O1-1]|nr:hypothetical protein [Paucibacter sp. O1-1]MDA3830071.1 hypothetical protein [Paucibacter sp. O1-1]